MPHEDQKDPRDKSYDVDAPLAELPSADELRRRRRRASAGCTCEGPPTARRRRTAAATAAAGGGGGGRETVDAPVPESLREALAAVSEADRALALAFFRQGFGGRAGAHEVTLSSDADGRVVLKLDFDAKSWKRVRKKVKAAGYLFQQISTTASARRSAAVGSVLGPGHVPVRRLGARRRLVLDAVARAVGLAAPHRAGRRGRAPRSPAHCGQSTASIRARSAFPRTTSWNRGGGGSGAPAAAAAATTTAAAGWNIDGVGQRRGGDGRRRAGGRRLAPPSCDCTSDGTSAWSGRRAPRRAPAARPVRAADGSAARRRRAAPPRAGGRSRRRRRTGRGGRRAARAACAASARGPASRRRRARRPSAAAPSTARRSTPAARARVSSSCWEGARGGGGGIGAAAAAAAASTPEASPSARSVERRAPTTATPLPP